MFSVFVRSHRLVVAGAMAMMLAACGGDPQTPEDRVRNVVAAMQAAVEEDSLRRAGELLHPAYIDKWHADRRAAVQTLFGILRRHAGIHLFSRIDQLSIGQAGDTAQAAVFVAMASVPIESADVLVSLNADLYRFDVSFAREGDEWLVRSADWRRVTLADWLGGS